MTIYIYIKKKYNNPEFTMSYQQISIRVFRVHRNRDEKDFLPRNSSNLTKR